MNILHVLTSVFKAGGGTSEVVPRMCEALVAAGHNVRLVTGGGDNPADAALRAKSKGVDIRYCPLHHIPHVGFYRMTHVFKDELIGGMTWSDVVHIHGHWQDVSWFAASLARKMRKPYVMQPHGFLEPERLKISKWQKRIIGALIERGNLNHANAVIATAESEKVGIERYGVKVPIFVVPIGIDTDAIDAAKPNKELLEKLGAQPGKKTLLYFSRITPVKGLDLLADAWCQLDAYHDKWQLLIVGPDDRGYTSIIKHLYRDKVKDDSVIFSGPVFGEDKNVLLRSVDAFVLPTRSENFSIAVQEALAAGLPTVCTKGAPWGIIAENNAGEWVEIEADAIADGLRRVFDADANCLMRMSAAGRFIIEKNFQWNAISKNLTTIYDTITRRCDEGRNRV